MSINDDKVKYKEGGNYAEVEVEDTENGMEFFGIENPKGGLTVLKPGEEPNIISRWEKVYHISSLVSSSIFCLACIVFYILSLEGCSLEQAECLKKQNQDTAVRIGKLIFASALMFALLIWSTYLRVSKAYFIQGMIVILLFLFYVYDTGADFATHGSYNRVFFYVFLTLQMIGLTILYIIFRLFLRQKILTTLGCIGAFFLIRYLKNEWIKGSCEYWDKGFKTTKISDVGNCKIYRPKWCFNYLTSNWFDVSALKGIDCDKDRNPEELYLLREKANRQHAKQLSFPRTEKWNFYQDSLLSEFALNVFFNMGDRNNRSDDDINVDSEFWIDYTGKHPEVVIQIQRNETLVEERQKKWKEHEGQQVFKNVFFIYFDAIARNHWRRKMKKSFKWFEDQYRNPESTHSSYQFLKYHSLNYFTYANMIPGYFGVFKFDEKADYFLYKYKEAGYITGQSTNVCEREGWDMEKAFEPYLNWTSYDHEFNSFYCDPAFADPVQPYQVFKGAYSIIRKCMYGKDSGVHQMDWAKKFITTYEDQPKMIRLIFSDAHEGTGESVKYLDEPLVEFLNWLKNGKHLDDSVLFIMSDHGVSMPGPAHLLSPDDHFNEVFLPTLFYLIPKNIPEYETYNKYLELNDNVFVTSFDIHSTLLNFVNRTQTTQKYGVSLMNNQINDYTRKCSDYKIEPSYCICYY
jgi:hypothetical protein